jgi:hypothetical protein
MNKVILFIAIIGAVKVLADVDAAVGVLKGSDENKGKTLTVSAKDVRADQTSDDDVANNALSCEVTLNLGFTDEQCKDKIDVKSPSDGKRYCYIMPSVFSSTCCEKGEFHFYFNDAGNSFSVNGINCPTAKFRFTGGDGNDEIRFDGQAHIEGIALGGGNDFAGIFGPRVDSIYTGSGNDYVNLDDGASLKYIDMHDGNDELEIEGMSAHPDGNTKVEFGDGKDKLYVDDDHDSPAPFNVDFGSKHDDTDNVIQIDCEGEGVFWPKQLEGKYKIIGEIGC